MTARPGAARILVIDDILIIRMLLGRALRHAGFIVTSAEDGGEGLALLSEGQLPDIVLLDVEMPGVNGWETLARVRREPRTAQLPVVMCTSESRSEDMLQGWSLGCDGYLVKPIDVATLAVQLRQILDRSPAERNAIRRASIAHLTRAS